MGLILVQIITRGFLSFFEGKRARELAQACRNSNQSEKSGSLNHGIVNTEDLT